MAAVLRALVFIAIGALVITVGDALWQSCQSGSWKQLVGQATSSSCVEFWLNRHQTLLAGLAALLAAWIWALLPSAAALSADALSDMSNLCLMLVALLCLMRGEQTGGTAPFFWSGLLSGAAYTIRPEGAEVALVAITIAILIRRVTTRRRFAAAIAASLGFALIGGTYAFLEGGRIINKQTWLQEEQTAFSGESDAEWVILNEPSAKRSLPPIPATALKAGIGNSVGAVVAKLSLSLRYIWLPIAILYLLLPKDRLARSPLALSLMLLLAGHTALLLWFHHRAGYLSHRHTVLLAVPTVIFAAGALVESAVLISERFGARFQHFDAIAVAGLSLSLSPWLFRDINSNRQYIHQAAQFVASVRHDRSPNIISQHGWTPFYAGLLNWSTCPRAARLADLPDLPTADLASFDTRESVPSLIHHRLTGTDFLVNEVARFTDPQSSRGEVIYRVAPVSGN